MRSLQTYSARPAAPPKPPLRTATGCGAGDLVRPASDTTISRSARFASRSANSRASVVPPRIRMRDMPVANEPFIETNSAHSAASPRWLSIVGIGEDGVDGLSAAARGLIGGADIVIGGRRHLALAAPLIRGAARAWPSPFDGAVEEVSAHRGRAVCVLASGDPFHYGVGAVLTRRIDPREMIVVPAPSAFSLAAARLGWSLPDTILLSLHGRSLDLIRPHLQPGARLIALTDDGNGPAALARLLAQSGFHSSRMTVLEALGGPRERIRSTSAAEHDFEDVDALNVVAIEVAAASTARVLPLVPGAAES